ncbi:hypothetical protein Hanom_Chr09g00783341 [Helianthus anomalus]
MLTIQGSSGPRVFHEDEGFNWSKYILEDDKMAFVAQIKERTKEEILQEKTYKEKYFADCRIQETQEEYEDARSCKRCDKKREYFVNRKGDPIVDRREVVYKDVLTVIPLSGEFYSKKASDKDYLKKLVKIIRGVMTASVKQREEERMKKSVEILVEELNKTAEESSGEERDKEIKKYEVADDESQKFADEELEKSVKSVTGKQQDDER